MCLGRPQPIQQAPAPNAAIQQKIPLLPAPPPSPNAASVARAVTPAGIPMLPTNSVNGLAINRAGANSMVIPFLPANGQWTAPGELGPRPSGRIPPAPGF